MKFIIRHSQHQSKVARCLACLLLLSAALAACAPSNSSERKSEQKGMAKNKTSAPAIVYAALGDSTGVGVGAKEGGYVVRLFNRIKSARADSRVVNLCVSGATTEDVLRGQLGQAVNARPTLVTLGIGINDVARNVPVEQFARNYETIVARIKKETNAPLVATNIPDIAPAPVVPAYARDEVRRRIKLFNDRIGEIVERHDALLVDTFETTRDVIAAHPEFFSADGFHPSDAGYEYWAKTMWPAVKRAIGEQ